MDGRHGYTPTALSLTFAEVHFSFRPGGGAEVLRGVNATAPRGALTALVGPNGAGKSTMLRLGLGLLTAPRGRVLLDGDDVSRMPAKVRSRRAAYVPQRGEAALGLTCGDVVRLGRYSCREGGRGESLARVLEEVELSALERAPFRTMSAGQRQRTILARALYQLDGVDPGCCALLADEPVSAMDPRHAERALSRLGEMARAGACVFVVLHDLAMVLRHAGWVILLSDRGSVLAEGTPATTLTAGALGSLYGAAFDVIEHEGRPVALHPRGDGPKQTRGVG